MLHNAKGQKHSVSAPLYSTLVSLVEQNLHACIFSISCIIIKASPRNCICGLLPLQASPGFHGNFFRHQISGWIIAANICGIA